MLRNRQRSSGPEPISDDMTPAGLLSISVLITGAAAMCEGVLGRMHRGRLMQLAAEWKMTYSARDPFRLTQRVTRHFPVPGAANIRVADLIYGIDRDMYRYIFTAQYTAGVLTGKHRVMRVASLTESRYRAGEGPAVQIQLAPAKLPLLEQYRSLRPASGDQ